MTNSKNKYFSGLFLSVLLLGTVLAGNISNLRSQIYSSVLPTTIANLSNQNRQQQSLPKLKTNSRLQKAAELQAENLAITGSTDHQNSWAWLDQVGYNYSQAGENIAVNFSTSDDNNLAWLSSSEHQQNLLNKNYSETGIGTATGTYQGRPATFIVQYFAQPAPIRENILTPTLQAYNDSI